MVEVAERITSLDTDVAKPSHNSNFDDYTNSSSPTDNRVGSSEHSSGGDDDEVEDFSGMPELCDNERAKGSVIDSDKAKSAGGKKPGEEVEESGDSRSGQLGVWDDVLGSGRLRKKITVLGTGERPERGSRVTICYTEALTEEGEAISTGEQEVEFNVGESEVIQALDLVVPLMCLGEKAIVQAASDFCYGDQGDGERVPPKSDLFFELELMAARQMPPAPDIPLPERYKIGNEKRLRGNRWYSRGDHSMAVQCYRKAVEYLDDEAIESELEAPIDRFLLPKELQALLEDRVKTYNNMAQAQMKLKAWDSALASIKQVLKIEPNNEKALFRKAKILEEKYRTEEAIGILRRVTRLYPDNKLALAELNSLLARQRKGKEKEQALSRKMLGIKDVDLAKKKEATSRQTKLILAVVGGLGALLGAVLAKTYNVF